MTLCLQFDTPEKTMISLLNLSDVHRFLSSDQNAVRRVHPVGSGNPVQQRQGAGPAESAGQIHEKLRYQTHSQSSKSYLELSHVCLFLATVKSKYRNCHQKSRTLIKVAPALKCP